MESACLGPDNEPFELHDNLMLAGGIVALGGRIVAETVPPAGRYTSLVAFERGAMRAAATLSITRVASDR